MTARYAPPILIACLWAAVATAGEFAKERDYNWHQWRGPLANGVAPQADPPLRWGEATNIRWKVSLPGEGSGTPIVWQDRIFVVAAIDTGRKAEARAAAADAKTEPPPNFYQFVLLCLDRQSGRELWRAVACEAAPHEGRHPTNSYASGSPTTDGERVYVSFGSRGVYCFDFAGKKLWQRDLGQMRTRFGWGEASTPTVHDGSLVVNWDHEGPSFITVLDATTGETKWKADRDEPTSWATPLVIEHDGRLQTIVNGTKRVRSYDLATGEVIWECGGQSVNAIPSPIVVGDVAYCMSGYRSSAAVVVPLSAKGDVTDGETVLWRHNQGTPYVPSPLPYGDQLYFTASNTAVLTSLDIKTGKVLIEPTRIPELSNIYSSPAAAAGRIYFVGRDGVTTVLAHGPKLDVLATNKLDEPIDASPVLVGKQLLLRGAQHLYCIEQQ